MFHLYTTVQHLMTSVTVFMQHPLYKEAHLYSKLSFVGFLKRGPL